MVFSGEDAGTRNLHLALLGYLLSSKAQGFLNALTSTLIFDMKFSLLSAGFSGILEQAYANQDKKFKA